MLQPLVNIVREGFGDTLLYAVTALSNLAYVPANRKAIIDSGVLVPLTQVLGPSLRRPYAANNIVAS
jgi:hypothetical protein